MRWTYKLPLRFRSLFHNTCVEKELRDEVRFHLERLIEQNTARGMTPEDARFAALRELGGVEQIKEECRDMRRVNLIEDLLRDLRYGLRVLAKNSGFAAIAILSLALGIGANAAIFQLLDSVRLRLLPVSAPRELTGIRIPKPRFRLGSFYTRYSDLSDAIWEQIRDRHEPFSGVFAWAPVTFNLSPRGEVHLVPGIWVSGDFFNVLGVRPVLGRVFTPADDQHGCGSAGAVISYAFWQQALGGDPAAVGRKLTVDYHPVEILGVTPPGFFGLEVGRSFDLALPICAEPVLGGEDSWVDTRSAWWLSVMGRLKPGWTVGKASAQLGSLAPGIFEATLPAGYDSNETQKYRANKLSAYPAGNGVSGLREESSSSLMLLLAITGLVLLIACANLANLMLARASAREREIAVRLAMGASRARLVRQLCIESVLLAATGAGLGLLVARTLARLLVSFLSTARDSILLNLAPDWRVFGFTAAIAILTTMLFGLMPALRATRIDPGAAMKAGGRTLTASRERFGMRRGLVVSQIAFSLVLLVAALMFSRSLRNLLSIDLGFQPNGILIVNLDMTQLNTPPARRLELKRELLERVRFTSGVDSAAESYIVPTGGSSTTQQLWMEGSSRTQAKDCWFNWISPDYFKTMETPLVAGRDFDERDRLGSPKVAIVNEAFARELAGGSNPVGKRVWRKGELNQPQTAYEIVGLVKNTKYQNMREPYGPVVYVPTMQDSNPDPTDTILVRSSLPPGDLVARIKQSVAAQSPEVAIDFGLFNTMIRDGLVGERLMVTLSDFFGLLALLLATLGLYGVMSYTMVRRTNEIGIRMTLGAGRGQIVGMVLSEAGLLLIWGLCAGVLLAIAGANAARSLVYGLQPYDPVALAGAAALLAAVTLAASYLPALRATKVDPMVALRYE
ncbi:MAG TPA: ABC transporter permease [Terriglobia bacterium]|nr:ABC transporter permease [Terriglobia bacterium]